MTGRLPARDDWRIWVVLAGRGFGKTRAGAEWVSALARAQSGRGDRAGRRRLRRRRGAVMVEGRSGLLAVARAEERDGCAGSRAGGGWSSPSGAEAFVYSAAQSGERCAGPSIISPGATSSPSGGAAQAAWDNLRLGLRLGERPRALVTTTPRPVPLLRRMLAPTGTVLTGGATPGQSASARRFHRGGRGGARGHAVRAAGAGGGADRGCRGGAVAARADRGEPGGDGQSLRRRRSAGREKDF